MNQVQSHGQRIFNVITNRFSTFICTIFMTSLATTHAAGAATPDTNPVNIIPELPPAELLVDRRPADSTPTVDFAIQAVQQPYGSPYSPQSLSFDGNHYYAAGIGSFFDISHFYQPNIRNEVVAVDESQSQTSVMSTPSHYEAYVGVAGSRLKYRDRDNQDYSLTGYEVKVGARTNDYFGLEFRLGKSDEALADDSLVSGSRVEVDHMISVLARPSFGISDTIRLHAVFGYSSIKRTISDQTDLSQSSSREKAGLSFGIGLQWQWQPSLSVSLDYLNLYDEDDESLQGISLGIALIHR